MEVQKERNEMNNNSFIKQLLSRFQIAPEKAVAFSVYDGEKVTNITYRQLLSDVLQAAGYFMDNYIHRQHIGLVFPGSYQWYVTFFAVVATGNTVASLNHYLPNEMLSAQCKKAQISLLITDTEMWSQFQDLQADIPCLRCDHLTSSASVTIADLPFMAPEDTMLLMFTSGTTGKSKTVEITDEIMHYAIRNQDEIMALVPRERIYFTVPVFHIAGIKLALGSLHRYYVLCVGRGPRYMLMDMPKLNPTNAFFVPSMIEGIIRLLRKTSSEKERQRIFGDRLHNIALGGAHVKHSTCHYLMELGYQVEIGYSMTELTGDGTWGLLTESTVGSVGKTFGEMECRIEDGELLFRGPSVMKGYFQDQEETNKLIQNGWLHTGDLGYCDKNGTFYITGRKKNIIILSNGENVCPEEIEATLGECEDILECMVYSDEKGICADVYTMNPEKAQVYIQEYNVTMPMFLQVYKTYCYGEPLPKNASGKIKRKENK